MYFIILWIISFVAYMHESVLNMKTYNVPVHEIVSVSDSTNAVWINMMKLAKHEEEESNSWIFNSNQHLS
jgi:hypothetical protein